MTKENRHIWTRNRNEIEKEVIKLSKIDLLASLKEAPQEAHYLYFQLAIFAFWYPKNDTKF